MWHKIEKTPSITLAYNYSNLAKRRQGEAFDYDSKDKAVFWNTDPSPNKPLLPPAGGTGKFLVEGKWSFEHVKDAVAFAEKYLVPYQEVVRIEEKKPPQVWGAKEVAGQIKLKKYANFSNAARYATPVEAPEVPDYVQVIYRNLELSDPPILEDNNYIHLASRALVPKESEGSCFIQLPDGQIVTRGTTLNKVDKSAKQLTYYDEVWVCQS